MNQPDVRITWFRRGYILAIGLGFTVVAACQQKMAQAPYFRAMKRVRSSPMGVQPGPWKREPWRVTSLPRIAR